MGKLVDFINNANKHYRHCGYQIINNNFEVYGAYSTISYRGEDSGAIYHDYDTETLLSINLEPYFNCKINDLMTVYQMLESLKNSTSPYFF